MNMKITWSFLDGYIAIDDDTYDGPGSPCGQGETEEEAADDLTRQLVEGNHHTDQGGQA